MIRNLMLAAALAMSALPGTAQTPSATEQLQKAIFAQNSQGNLDSAIAIYRQLAYAGLTPRDVAAEAQYRLAQALLAKGDITAATREFERMERDFADYQKLVSGLAGARAPAGYFEGHVAVPRGAAQEGALQIEATHSRFDAGAQFAFQGKIVQVSWANPRSVMVVDAGSQKYMVQLTSPQALMQQGVTRSVFTLGQEVAVQAIRPNQGRLASNATEVVQANVIRSADGKVLFDWSKVPEITRAPVEPVK